MICLVTKALPTLREHAHPHLGRLVQPRHTSSLAATAASGLPWAADNDCFQRLHIERYDAMLDALAVVAGSRWENGRVIDRQRGSGLLFVTVPDVVADARATLRQWVRWQAAPRRRGLPVAFVAQDGCEHGLIPPWWQMDALFIGGSTPWKLGPAAERVVHAAKRAGKWVHMGRVNSARRAAYAAAIGCDSFDGTGAALFTRTHLPSYLAWAQAPRQLVMHTVNDLAPERDGAAGAEPNTRRGGLA